ARVGLRVVAVDGQRAGRSAGADRATVGQVGADGAAADAAVAGQRTCVDGDTVAAAGDERRACGDGGGAAVLRVADGHVERAALPVCGAAAGEGDVVEAGCPGPRGLRQRAGVIERAAAQLLVVLDGKRTAVVDCGRGSQRNVAAVPPGRSAGKVQGAAAQLLDRIAFDEQRAATRNRERAVGVVDRAAGPIEGAGRNESAGAGQGAAARGEFGGGAGPGQVAGPRLNAGDPGPGVAGPAVQCVRLAQHELAGGCHVEGTRS